jgi:hypothetical protein
LNLRSFVVVNPKKDKSEILDKAKERFKLAEEAWKPIFDEGLDDLKFLSGDQWNEADKQSRKLDGRPCLSVNRLPQYTRQVINDQRQNSPSIKVSPVDDKADIDTAKIFQGLIRHIEQSSKADRAYGRAFEGAVENSFGFFRVRTDYCSPESFEQDILIDQIPDPFLVKYDPFFKEPDGSDANWAFVESIYSKDDYCAEYGDSALGKEHDWKSLSEMPSSYGWVTEKTARVCEYFCKEYQKKSLVKLSTGEVIEKEKFVEGVINPQDGMPITVVAEKTANVPVIHHYKINDSDVLEETIFPGQFIPVIPVLGKEIIVNGRRILESLIRHAKDPQRMLNYWVTCETETIALAPKAPFLVAEGQIPPEYQEMWRTANTKNHAFLPYKPTDFRGNPVPPPQRQVFEPPVQAITNARMQATEELKATTGMYDAALGARSNENSGIAIQRRSAQTQTSNFHFVDNLSRSIRHCGRIIVDIAPQIYDTPRTARIIGDEGEEEVVLINQLFSHKGEEKVYRLDAGKYDVSIDTGPSYATKRQEALASMIDLTKAYPQVVQLAGDLMVKNMDWPGAQEISERLKKSLPPGLAEGSNQKPLPPEVEAEMAQMNQMIQALSQQLNQAKDALKTKAIELESKERIEFAKLENNLLIEQAKHQGQAALAAFQEELSDIRERLKLLRMSEPIEQDFNGSGLAPQGLDPQGPAVNPNLDQQPTGGISPGPHMGDQPWQS